MVEGGGGLGGGEEGAEGLSSRSGISFRFEAAVVRRGAKINQKLIISRTFPVLTVCKYTLGITHTHTHARTHARTHTIQLLGTNSLFIFVHRATSFISFTSSLKTLNSFHKHFLQFHCQRERERQGDREKETQRERASEVCWLIPRDDFRARACVRACVRACMRACARARALSVFICMCVCVHLNLCCQNMLANVYKNG